MIFFILLFLIFLEALGLSFFKENYIFIFLLSPFLLFFLKKNELIKIPKRTATFFSIFLVFSFFTIFYSPNWQWAFEKWLIYLTGFIFFIYTYNNQEYISSKIWKFIIFESFIFIFFLILNPFLTKLNPVFIITNYYQLTTPSSYPHNHLGDFLVLPLLFFSNKIFNKKYFLLIPFIFIFYYFLTSYTRSGYLSFIVGILMLIIYQYQKKIKFNLINSSFIFLIILIPYIFLFITTKEINSFIPKENRIFNFKKEFLAKRDVFLNQGMEIIKKRPLVGAGLDNYFYSSMAIDKSIKNYKNYPVGTSHNLIIDLFVETGVIGGMCFLFFIFYLLKNNILNLFFVSQLAILLNFQTDYTFKIPSFLLIWFIFCGLSLKEKNVFIKTFYFKIISIFLFIIGILIIGSNFFYSIKKYETAFYLYPLNKNNLNNLIYEKKKQGMYPLFKKYEKIQKIFFSEEVIF